MADTFTTKLSALKGLLYCKVNVPALFVMAKARITGLPFFASVTLTDGNGFFAASFTVPDSFICADTGIDNKSKAKTAQQFLSTGK